jgi:hypothetical protein
MTDIAMQYRNSTGGSMPIPAHECCPRNEARKGGELQHVVVGIISR